MELGHRDKRYLIHTLIIVRQGQWYRDIDAAFAQNVGVSPVRRPGIWGTHPLYAAFHAVLAGVLFAGAVALLWFNPIVRITP